MYSDLTLISVSFVSIIVGIFLRKAWARFTWMKRNFDRIEMVDIDSLTYQYIVDAHLLVIDIVGLDPLRDIVLFQRTLLDKIELVDQGIEALRSKYIESILETEFGKTINSFDNWKQKRNSWVAKKKRRTELKLINNRRSL